MRIIILIVLAVLAHGCVVEESRSVPSAGSCPAITEERPETTLQRAPVAERWTQRATGLGNLRAVAAIGNDYVAVGDQVIATSLGGKPWQIESTPRVELHAVTRRHVNHVAFLAVGADVDTGMPVNLSSEEGHVWQTFALPSSSPCTLKTIETIAPSALAGAIVPTRFQTPVIPRVGTSYQGSTLPMI